MVVRIKFPSDVADRFFSNACWLACDDRRAGLVSDLRGQSADVVLYGAHHARVQILSHPALKILANEFEGTFAVNYRAIFTIRFGEIQSLIGRDNQIFKRRCRRRDDRRNTDTDACGGLV